ncbi:MAG: hypothetical protein ABSE73_00365 [Planctomycetota bacterium]
MRKPASFLFLLLVALACGGTGYGAENKEAAGLAAKLAGGETAERSDAENKLRALGAAAIPALRAAQPPNDEDLARVRNVLANIVLETVKVDPGDAALAHEIAREEGKAERYANAARLYHSAQKLFEKLKDDAGNRKDRVKERQYKEKQQVCERMKDKADRKLKGAAHGGLNLGLVRIGGEHDVNDNWE